MKKHFTGGHAQRPAADGPPRALLLEEPERPRLRLRPDTNGRPRQPRRRRFLQPLPIAGALLVLVALLGYLSVYAQTTRHTQVLIAAHTLPAGSVLRPTDVVSAGLAGDPQVLAALIPAGEEQLVVGRTLRTAIASGTPVPAAAFAAAGSRAALFTLAVPVLHALAGALTPGDRVSVLATFTDSAGHTSTRAVARNLAVVAVGRPSGFDSSQQTIPITVALPDPAFASTLALANEAGKLDLLREGSSQAAPIPPVSANGTGS